MTKKKTPAPRRAGTMNQQERFARVLDAAGRDPASLLLMIATMERIVAETNPRRRGEKMTRGY